MRLRTDRVLLTVVASAALLLSGCASRGSDDVAAGRDSSSTSSREAGKPAARGPKAAGTVSVADVSFAVPEGFTVIDAKELAEGGGLRNPVTDEISDRLGVTPRQFVQMLSSVEMLMFSEAGAHGGFLDNVNVLQDPRAVPNDAQLRVQLLQLGAHTNGINRVFTDLGEVAVADYTLALDGRTIEGRGILVPSGAGSVAITVSTTDAGLSDELADRIVDSLQAA